MTLATALIQLHFKPQEEEEEDGGEGRGGEGAGVVPHLRSHFKCVFNISNESFKILRGIKITTSHKTSLFFE